MMNRQTAKKPVLAALALVLCLSAAVGGAMAYFTDYEDAQGGAVIRLGGQTEIDEGSDTRNKHVVITNTGETNVIVRAAVLYSFTTSEAFTAMFTFWAEAYVAVVMPMTFPSSLSRGPPLLPEEIGAVN